MLAGRIHDLGYLLIGLALLIGVIVGSRMLLTHRFKSMQVDVGNVRILLEGVAEEVASISKSVNNVPEDEPTLVQRVSGLEELNAWEVQAIAQIAKHVGCKVSTPPASQRWHW